MAANDTDTGEQLPCCDSPTIRRRRAALARPVVTYAPVVTAVHAPPPTSMVGWVVSGAAFAVAYSSFVVMSAYALDAFVGSI